MNHEIDILLVEDNMSDAEMIVRALKKNNITDKLVHLRDGSEALDFIFAEGPYLDREAKKMPKVIFLDLKMPKVNGLQVLQRVKSDERTRKIPIVILTSSNEDTDIRECYNLGINSYIVKPVQFEEFTKVISKLGLYWTSLNKLP